MKLNLEQIKSVTKGVEDIVYEKGLFHFYRFSQDEEKLIDNHNLFSTAGVQMEFCTDALELKLKVNTKNGSPTRSYFAVDVFVDGTFIGSIKNFEEGIDGDYANVQYELGDFEGAFGLGENKKVVRIVFPHSVVASISEMELVGATYVSPVKNEKNVIFYGDSITQGYDTLHPSKSYANLLGESLHADLRNKALGGAQFFPELVGVPNDYTPDYIVVAYGTNDWSGCEKEEVRKNATRFLDNVVVNYPTATIYVVSPIWRKIHTEYKKFGSFLEMEKLIEELCQNRKNISFISGFDLVPPEEKYLAICVRILMIVGLNFIKRIYSTKSSKAE